MEDQKTYKVIQWCTGSIGQISIRHFTKDPAFELVGAYVTSDAKHGKDQHRNPERSARAGRSAGQILGGVVLRDVNDVRRRRAAAVERHA